MRPFVHPIIVDRAIANREKEYWRDEEQRRVQHHTYREGKRLLRLRVPLPQTASIVRISEVILATVSMVFGPVKRPETIFVFSQPVEHVFVRDPLDGVAIEQPKKNL